MEIRDEELEKLYAETFQGIESGAILTGRVVSVKPDAVVVDVGYKSEGIVQGREFAHDEIAGLNAGDSIEVFVESVSGPEGMVVLSKNRAAMIKRWTFIEESFNNGDPVEGVIVEKTKGGAFVDIYGIKAFLPGSHIDVKPVRDVESLMGEKMRFKVIKINNRRSNVIVSRRLHLEDERKERKASTLEVLKEGAVVEGVVKNITDYGVFVDLGGIDGLLHISDISWGRISHPSKHFSVNDDIEVVVLEFEREKERVTLGYKQKMQDPWSRVEEKYPPGTRVSGTVVSVTDYGAFVEVEEALEGLVHASEVEWASRPKHPSKYLSVGDRVEAVVLKSDSTERRLSLSLKQIKPSPWQLVAERYRVGQVVTGKIRGITEFGAFMGLEEGVDGLIHISDISWTKHIKHPSEVIKKGQTIEAVILAIEPENERMALGTKQLQADPWSIEIPEKYRLGAEFRCKALRTTEYGIFVEIEGDVEGLIYSSEVVETDGPVAEGDELIARIIKVDFEGKKLGLSMRNVRGIEE
jgi:small subunit ribosomal protein S1